MPSKCGKCLLETIKTEVRPLRVCDFLSKCGKNAIKLKGFHKRRPFFFGIPPVIAFFSLYPIIITIGNLFFDIINL